MLTGYAHKKYETGQGERTAGAEAYDRALMLEAIALAGRATARVSPNPPVGCVIVSNDETFRGEIVGRGWHEGPGRPHAEVAALRDAGARARGASVYVTLEPCNHHGRTGPCSDALIAAGVREVVYAVADPNPVAAGGAARLAAAGVVVRGGVCEDEARWANRRWLTATETGRPYVIAKTATTLDGRIATRSGQSKWITGAEARARVHEMRAGVDAIITGAGTVRADDPAMTARPNNGHAEETPHNDDFPAARQPLRVVVDTAAQTWPGAKIYERGRDASHGPGALLATTAAAPEARLAAFREMGVEILVLPTDERGGVDLAALLDTLYARGLRSAMLEAGGRLTGAFFDADLIDELVVMMAPKVFGGGATALAGAGVSEIAAATRFSFGAPELIGDDIVFTGARTTLSLSRPSSTAEV